LALVSGAIAFSDLDLVLHEAHPNDGEHAQANSLKPFGARGNL
jgi:hypothetical protein